MYWMDKVGPDALVHFEELQRQWQASVEVRDAIPKEEHGNFTAEEIQAGLMWDGVPANASDRYKEAQGLQHRLYDAMCQAEVWYCRRNIWGMRLLRQVMETLDMVRSNYGMDECPFEWPDAAWKDDPDEGEHWDRYYEYSHGSWSQDQEAEFERDYPDVMKAFREYKEARTARLTWVPEECFKVYGEAGVSDEIIDETPHAIPIHKLGSNDDWIITPTECSAVLAKARRVSEDDIRLVYRSAGADWDPIENWQSWLTFIEGAASHGGFRVA